MSVSLNYEEISLSEKFNMLEELWANMTQNANQSGFTPGWHIDELKSREEKIVDKKSSFSDIEDVKERLQKMTF